MINELKKYKIGVLAGGTSSERDISIKSGNAVFEGLRRVGLDVLFLDVREEDFSTVISRSGIEMAFIALHGRFGEDGTVQRMLDNAGVPYTGSGPAASKLALDKLLSKEVFSKEGIMVPEYGVTTSGKEIESLPVRSPCVIKPRYEGSSMGLSTVFSDDLMAAAIDRALIFGNEIIVERFIPGREITVGILDDRPLPIVEIITSAGIYDFEAKYDSSDTRYVVPAQIDDATYLKAQETGLKAHLALGCRDFSRVDIRLSDSGEPFVLEVNTIPGLTERSLLPMAAKADGMDFSELCVKMLCGALKRGENTARKY